VSADEGSATSGFTLIELIVVIIILGILAVVAVPRFIDVKDEAFEASMLSQFSAFKSAVTLYHGAWLVKGNNAAVENLDNFGDGTVDSSSSGFPYATSGTGTNAFTACGELWRGVTNTDFTIGYVQDSDLATTNKDIAYTYSATQCIYRVVYFMQQRRETLVMRYSYTTGETTISKGYYSID